jgi:hypothetical protein
MAERSIKLTTLFGGSHFGKTYSDLHLSSPLADRMLPAGFFFLS